MTKKPERPEDVALEPFFSDARAAAPRPSGDLIARVMSDAQGGRPVRGLDTARRGGLLERLTAALGGWPALGGMAAAGMAGVWIGYAFPAGLSALGAELLVPEGDYELVELMPTVDMFLQGG
ncbi:hypothetical protein C8N32_11141 [Rhodovulum imhoffii]|uniref:Dihydroorotate dehydrogenase n=1 Tax=Rhodovulum imhoffii TaxID=365340 RepID=A0A2T5BR14_9RHOB|nr:hypothetical protein [Rhodovulum imhoffii]MBK5932575.1 hypothetical protein [Rhodovulum imhoffii]PTN01642.1 hypothetical protein C8N32_11141 [Rhodovulum imhoffii]